ncbi:MAG: ribosome biogenesis GTP-binding protein YihA/YsxC [Eubacteriales bacterium]|jgi:GTP-binding protein
MVIKDASLDIVCGITSRLPDTGEPEVAFAGKSNVGKSSLINALLNRKALARTSSTPGKTQTINFYHVNRAFYLVDLPGYGFTNASPSVRQSWGRMIERYLKQSQTLINVFLLVDIRHEPNANDCQMYDWIRANGYQPVVIGTKLDKLKKSQVQKQIKICREALGMEDGDIFIPFSAQTKEGRDSIWDIIEGKI